MKFRKDINGLRAIAVIAVVLFHFNATWMPGGFAGVDVFFVISGFLMTGIIFRGIEQNNFFIAKFYMARANRIIPALALLCLVLLVIGWFYLTPTEYRTLGKHAATSVSFVSNFIYGTETGYFDVTSHEKWLLHSWSLSVEWQFYIVYPLLLVAMSKFLSIKAMKFALLSLTILGFIFCIFATYQWPILSYYYLPTRGWEMMLGGLAYLYPLSLTRGKQKVVNVLGLMLIIGSYVFISAADPWPGYLAAFPVVGAFLIIQAQCNDSIITNNALFQKLGTWSYSIYLWHWPIVVAIYYLSLSSIYSYLGMVLSVILGYLSYNYIENFKFKKDFISVTSYLFSKPIIMVVIVIALGTIVYKKSEEITPYRLSASQISIIEQQKEDPRESDCGKVKNGISPGCIYGEGDIKAIVVGDSHAQAQNVAIGNRAALMGGSIVSFGLAGCPTIENVYKLDDYGRNSDDNCGKLVANTINIAAEKYPDIPVIIINRVSQYINGANEESDAQSLMPSNFVDKVFSERDTEYKENIASHMVETICKFSESNPVYLQRPTPEMKVNIPLVMFKSTLSNKDIKSIKISRDEYEQRQTEAFAMQNKAVESCGAKILDPIPYLCNSQWCYGDTDKTPLYFDDDHLSSYGSAVIAPIYDEVFESIN